MRLMLICSVIGFYIYQILLSSSGLLRYFQIQDRIEQKATDMETVQKRNNYLKSQIHLLKQDPLTIEYAIRESYGYIKADEIVVEIKPAKN